MDLRRKMQRKLKGSSDRFLVTVSEEVGKEIRERAEKEGLSYSAFIGLIVEDYLEKDLSAVHGTGREGEP